MSESGLNRREFLVVSAVTACVCALNCPRAGAGDPPPLPPQKYEVGSLSDFAKDGVVDSYAKSGRFLLVTASGRLYALAAQCTHKFSIIKPVDGEMRCPAHGARYGLDGKVTKGPALESLMHYGISVAGGKVTVDTGQTFAEGNWTEGSFIKLA